MMNKVQSLEIISSERDRQKDIWGEQHRHPYEWLAILMEGVGEAANAALHRGEFGYRRNRAYLKEVAHVAAVAVAMIEDIDIEPEYEEPDIDDWTPPDYGPPGSGAVIVEYD